MIRSILAVIVAVVTWIIVATIGSWILRAGLPGYRCYWLAQRLKARSFPRVDNNFLLAPITMPGANTLAR